MTYQGGLDTQLFYDLLGKGVDRNTAVKIASIPNARQMTDSQLYILSNLTVDNKGVITDNGGFDELPVNRDTTLTDIAGYLTSNVGSQWADMAFTEDVMIDQAIAEASIDENGYQITDPQAIYDRATQIAQSNIDRLYGLYDRDNQPLKDEKGNLISPGDIYHINSGDIENIQDDSLYQLAKQYRTDLDAYNKLRTSKAHWSNPLNRTLNDNLISQAYEQVMQSFQAVDDYIQQNVQADTERMNQVGTYFNDVYPDLVEEARRKAQEEQSARDVNFGNAYVNTLSMNQQAQQEGAQKAFADYQAGGGQLDYDNWNYYYQRQLDQSRRGLPQEAPPQVDPALTARNEALSREYNAAQGQAIMRKNAKAQQDTYMDYISTLPSNLRRYATDEYSNIIDEYNASAPGVDLRTYLKTYDINSKYEKNQQLYPRKQNTARYSPRTVRY